jgi:cob(I)alamin adenosyltransferase
VRIYTRAGDDGTTGTLGAGRIAKSDPRIEAYGSVDELNATLGGARAADSVGWLGAELEAIQRQLFQVGAELATTESAMLAALTRVTDADVSALEATIDRLEAGLPALTAFVLPAGTVLAAQLHVARTVCRRAERRVVALGAAADVEPRLVRYLNRLGDLLFVMARWANHRAGAGDVEWRAGPPA